MKLPFVIEGGLNSTHAEKWQKQFVANNRSVFESIWRRTQDEKNSELSGWKSPLDKRRRIVHFYDSYDVSENGSGYEFKLLSPYLWVSLAFPMNEIAIYRTRIDTALKNGGWKIKEDDHDAKSSTYYSGDLLFTISSPTSYPEDLAADRTFPDNYQLLDCLLSSDKTLMPTERKSHPWDVIKTGIRNKDVRGEPHVVTDLKEIASYFPMQVELGCGPSIEVGVPPLHYLHRVYSVSDPISHQFILSPEQDTLLIDILSNPENFYVRASAPYLRSVTATPNEFFKLLKELHSKGLIVGDVITNNFDGLSSLVGLTEKYVRQYAEAKIVPQIDFHSEAKSLVVIGAHADRRLIQRKARESGLKIIYIDPEGYYGDTGEFSSYPLEAPQDTDLLIHMTSSEFARKFRETFSNLL